MRAQNDTGASAGPSPSSQVQQTMYLPQGMRTAQVTPAVVLSSRTLYEQQAPHIDQAMINKSRFGGSFSNMAPLYAMQHQQVDVHAKTHDIQIALLAHPGIVDKMNALESSYPAAKKITLRLFKDDQNIVLFFQLMDARAQTHDADALGVSCGGAFAMLVSLIAYYEFEPSLVRLLKETMYDMGVTCVQGYTHRMVWLILMMIDNMEETSTPNTPSTAPPKPRPNEQTLLANQSLTSDDVI